MFKINIIHSDLPEMYKEPSEQDKENMHQMYYNHRTFLNNDRIDICQGNVIKASSIKESTEGTYEDKVNEILQQSGLNDQSNIDDIVQKTAQAQKILQKNSIQTRINNLIEDNER